MFFCKNKCLDKRNQPTKQNINNQSTINQPTKQPTNQPNKPQSTNGLSTTITNEPTPGAEDVARPPTSAMVSKPLPV